MIHSFAFLDGFGGGEMMWIMLVALLLFGGDKLPGFAKGLGKAIREFKKAAGDVESELKRAIEEVPDTPRPKPPTTFPPYPPAVASPGTAPHASENHPPGATTTPPAPGTPPPSVPAPKPPGDQPLPPPAPPSPSTIWACAAATSDRPVCVDCA